MGSLRAGDVLAGYTIISELGSGGMGTVYLARPPRLSRNQALKVLDSALGADPSFRDRFRREAQLAARLDHPNIVAVHDAGVDDGVGTGDDDRAGPATSTPRVAQPTPGDGRPAPVPQPTTVNPPAGAPLTGTWRGAVTGDDSGFDVVVTFAGSNPVRATVEYPQIPCAGTWSDESRRGDTISLVERVTSGPCVTSQITLDRRPDGTLGFRSDYFAESRGRTLTIYATQRRA